MALRTSFLGLAGLAAVAVLKPAPALAVEGLKTPSNNIICILDESDAASPALRCDTRNFPVTRLRPPKDCPLGWGDAYAISANGKSGARICHGDTIMHEDVDALPYGAAWQRGGFTCQSTPTGLTCRNGQGHGFSLSRAAQRLF